MRQGTRTPERFRLASAAATILLLSVAWAGPGRAAEPALPAVLDLTPPQFQIIVVAPSLTGLSQKVALLNESMGLSLPWMTDTLGEVKHTTGMMNGIKNDGSMALVALDLSGAGDQTRPAVLLLMPVSDYTAFVTGLKGNAAETVTQVTFTSGHQAYSREAAGFAVLSPRKDLIENFRPAHAGAQIAQRIGNAGTACVAKSDLSLIIDVAAAQPALEARFNQTMFQVSGWFDTMASGNAIGQVVGRAMVGTWRDAGAAGLRDTTVAVVGVDIDALGLGVTAAGQLKPDSATAKLFAAEGGADHDLAMLPPQPYLLASAVDFRGVKIPQVLANLQDELGQRRLGWLSELIKSAKPMIDDTTGAAQVCYAPAGGLAASPPVTATIFNTTNGQAFVDAFKAYLQQLNNSKIDLGGMTGAPADASTPASANFSNLYSANALQIDNLAVDQYEIHCDLPLPLVSQMGSGAAMMVLGMASQRGYVVVMDKTVIVTSVTDRQLMAGAIATVKNGGGLDMNASLKQVHDHLGINPLAEVYLHPGAIAQALLGLNPVAPANNSTPQLQVPADLPPVGWSLSFQDGAVVKRVYFPMPVVKFGRDAVRFFESMAPAAPPTPTDPAPQPGMPPARR